MITYIAILGILASIVLFVYALKSFKPNIYLALFFFFNSIYLMAFDAVCVSDDIVYAAVMNWHFMPFLYLTGPFAYFYVRSLITNDTLLKKIDFIHFLPMMLLLVGIFPYYFESFQDKILLVKAMQQDASLLTTNHNWLVPQYVNLLSRPLLLIIYFAVTIIYLVKNGHKLQDNAIVQFIHIKRVQRWLYLFLITSLCFVVLVFFDTVWLYMNTTMGIGVNLMSRILVIEVIIIGVGYLVLNGSLFLMPNMLYGFFYVNRMPAWKELPNVDEEISAHVENMEDKQILNDTLFTEDYLEKIRHLILRCIDSKIFILPDFDMQSFSKSTGIPKHHLSYYLNNIEKIKFADWRNNLRIQYASELVKQGFLQQQTTEALAKKCGYMDDRNFYKAVKKITGLTPKAYFEEFA
jgi:AraC-type DNA-binding domain-containing proteins